MIQKMKQQSLWAFFKKKCPQTIVCLLTFVYVANAMADERINVEAPRLQPGTTGQIAIVLENTTEITAFQFDITLSEGLTIAQSKGKYGIALTSRASSTHQFSTLDKEDGSLRVAAYSMNNTAFEGTSGALLLIDVNVANDCGEEESIMLRNIRLTTKSVSELKLNNVTVAIHISGLIGDVNGDGAVDVADISSVIDVMSKGTNDKAADVNRDGAIDVADIATIIDIMASNARRQTELEE